MLDFDDQSTALDDEDGFRLLVTQVPLASAPPELVAFVQGTLQDYLSSAGKARTKRWCARWEEHPDAVHRLAAIYDEYLLMIAGGKGAPSLHVFMRDVIDYHLPRLVDKEYGVFRECDEGHLAHRRIDSEAAPVTTPALGG